MLPMSRQSEVLADEVSQSQKEKEKERQEEKAKVRARANADGVRERKDLKEHSPEQEGMPTMPLARVSVMVQALARFQSRRNIFRRRVQNAMESHRQVSQFQDTSLEILFALKFKRDEFYVIQDG